MNKKIIALTLASATLLALPVAMFAIGQPAIPQSNQALSVIGIINVVLSFLWPLFIGFAVIMFIIAAFFFVTAQGEADKVGEARQFLIWGVVGVAVGILAFSIPYVVQFTLCQGGIC